MHTISNKRPLRDLLCATRRAGKTIGLVPTMGNLHDGHLQLVKAAQTQADFVVCTIFVNPLQFGPHEDLDAYPRTLGEDIAKLASVGCDCLFIPAVSEMYAGNLGEQATVQVPELTQLYCGKSRPGHFEGVATIVCKLFNLVQPNTAVFGLKDYQQFLVIRKMITDLEFDIALVGVEIQREAHGLALSSRNRYLNDEQQQKAALIYQSLLDIEKRIRKGNQDFAALETLAIQRLHDSGFKVDYFSICNANTLQAASKLDREFAILTAVQVGPSRLLDNVRFTLETQ
jgi:pantoate--beta-alanine ligase